MMAYVNSNVYSYDSDGNVLDVRIKMSHHSEDDSYSGTERLNGRRCRKREPDDLYWYLL